MVLDVSLTLFGKKRQLTLAQVLRRVSQDSSLVAE